MTTMVRPKSNVKMEKQVLDLVMHGGHVFVCDVSLDFVGAADIRGYSADSHDRSETVDLSESVEKAVASELWGASNGSSLSASPPFLDRFERTALTIAQITATAISSTPMPPSRNTKNCFGSLAHHQRFIGTCMPQSSVTTPMKHVNTPSAMVEPLLPEGLMMSSPICRFLRPPFAPATEAV